MPRIRNEGGQRHPGTATPGGDNVTSFPACFVAGATLRPAPPGSQRAPEPEARSDVDEQQKPVEAIRGATTLAGDLAAIAGGRVTAALLSAVTVLFTTRMLGPAGYGTVTIVGVVATLVFTASTAWTGIAVRRYGREDLELRGQISRLTWNRVVIGAPIAAVAVLLVVSLKAFNVLPETLSWQLVAIALATGVATMATDHWVCLLETGGRMKVSAGGQVMSQALYVGALVIVFALGRHASPQLVLTLALGAALVFAIAIAPTVWSLGVVPVVVDRPLLRRMLWLSTPTIGLMASQYVFSSVDIVALRAFRSQADVGLYGLAYQAFTVLSGVAVTATAVFVPLLVSLQMAGRTSLIQRYLRSGVPQGLFVIATLLGVGVPLLPLIVPILFGPKFAAAAGPLSVLMVALAFLFAGYLVAPILDLKEQTRTVAVINAGAAVINVGGDLLLIGVLHAGIIGPAIATSAGLAFIFFGFYGRARRALDMKVRPDLSVAMPLVAGVTPALILGGVPGALVGTAGAIAATVAVLEWRAPFDAEDVQLVEKLELPAAIKALALRTLQRVT